MTRFAGKVGLVTGASQGLGRETARGLVAEGASVVVVGRDSALLNETIAGAGGAAAVFAGDIRYPETAERAVAYAVSTFGGLDVLVNSAGVLRRGPLDDFEVDDWNIVFETNTRGPYLMLKYAVPAMRARGGGSIVNVSSVYAYAAVPGSAAYSASKAALVALTKVAALDHIADGIRINCVAPGSMPTPMVFNSARERSSDPSELIDALARAHPIGRLLEPQEVVNVILFLASDEASGVVGACYVADGGRLGLIGSSS